jgi:hypothetical protein
MGLNARAKVYSFPPCNAVSCPLRRRVELGGPPRMVEAVVHRDRQGQHQLTSWQGLLRRESR